MSEDPFIEYSNRLQQLINADMNKFKKLADLLQKLGPNRHKECITLLFAEIDKTIANMTRESAKERLLGFMYLILEIIRSNKDSYAFLIEPNMVKYYRNIVRASPEQFYTKHYKRIPDLFKAENCFSSSTMNQFYEAKKDMDTYFSSGLAVRRPASNEVISDGKRRITDHVHNQMLQTNIQPESVILPTNTVPPNVNPDAFYTALTAFVHPNDSMTIEEQAYRSFLIMSRKRYGDQTWYYDMVIKADREVSEKKNYKEVVAKLKVTFTQRDPSSLPLQTTSSTTTNTYNSFSSYPEPQYAYSSQMQSQHPSYQNLYSSTNYPYPQQYPPSYPVPYNAPYPPQTSFPTDHTQYSAYPAPNQYYSSPITEPYYDNQHILPSFLTDENILSTDILADILAEDEAANQFSSNPQASLSATDDTVTTNTKCIYNVGQITKLLSEMSQISKSYGPPLVPEEVQYEQPDFSFKMLNGEINPEYTAKSSQYALALLYRSDFFLCSTCGLRLPKEYTRDHLNGHFQKESQLDTQSKTHKTRSWISEPESWSELENIIPIAVNKKLIEAYGLDTSQNSKKSTEPTSNSTSNIDSLDRFPLVPTSLFENKDENELQCFICNSGFKKQWDEPQKIWTYQHAYILPKLGDDPTHDEFYNSLSLDLKDELGGKEGKLIHTRCYLNLS